MAQRWRGSRSHGVGYVAGISTRGRVTEPRLPSTTPPLSAAHSPASSHPLACLFGCALSSPLRRRLSVSLHRFLSLLACIHFPTAFVSWLLELFPCALACTYFLVLYSFACAQKRD